MTIDGGPVGEARLRALQGATQTYARLWQAPQLPVAIGAAQLLAGLALFLLDDVRAGQFLVWYSPLTWAIANRIARVRWAPPLGEVTLHWTEGGSLPRSARVLASLGLATLVAGAALLREPHLAVVGVGTITLLWTAPARSSSGLPFVIAACVFLWANERTAGILLGLAGALFAGAVWNASRRRAVGRAVAGASGS